MRCNTETPAHVNPHSALTSSSINYKVEETALSATKSRVVEVKKETLTNTSGTFHAIFVRQSESYLCKSFGLQSFSG
jgi:hypothetical protein